MQITRTKPAFFHSSALHCVNSTRSRAAPATGAPSAQERACFPPAIPAPIPGQNEEKHDLFMTHRLTWSRFLKEGANATVQTQTQAKYMPRMYALPGAAMTNRRTHHPGRHLSGLLGTPAAGAAQPRLGERLREPEQLRGCRGRVGSAQQRLGRC